MIGSPKVIQSCIPPR